MTRKIAMIAAMAVMGSVASAQFSTGFETPFTLGAINGQQGFTVFTATTASSAFVSDVNPNGGSQHLRLTKNTAAADGVFMGAFTPVFTPVSTNARAAVDIAISALDAVNGPDTQFIVQSVGTSQVTARVNLSFDGDILVQTATGFVDTGTNWTAGGYKTLEVILGGGLLTYKYDGVQIFQGATFAGTAFDQAIMFNDNFGAGIFGDFDNLSVAAVPEPATLAALGLGAVAMLRRRRSSK